MNKKWEFYNIDKEKVAEIANKFNISELLATILVNRRIIEDEDIKVFLEPNRNNFNNPFLLPDMEKSVERIIKAINNKEKVLIYGDYDVDGITSTTVLKKFLEDRDLIVDYYIPNRLYEGYGLNKEAINKINDSKYTLIITVDCGISAIEEIDYINSFGIDVIVTDHHEPTEVLPKAYSIIDAKRQDSKYPFRELAGVGVVFKLIQAIGIKLELEEKEYLKYLDIVSIGTISDIVPLVKENRVIAKLGLKLLAQTKNQGMRALISKLGNKNIESSLISFGIAPKINACGRMGMQERAIELFLTNNIVMAQKITQELEMYNKERQAKERKIYEEAINEIEEKKLYNKDIIVLLGENWHHGVIGIVASKITDKYFKPTLLFSKEEEKAVGSGRSITGIDLYEMLGEVSQYFEKYGGHEMAVGATIKTENFLMLKESIEKVAESKNINKIPDIIYIDKQIYLKELNQNHFIELKYLEPSGEGNKIPIFLFKNLKIFSIRTLSEGKHIKLNLKEENYVIEAIGFGLGHYIEDYFIGDKINIVGNIDINNFNGKNHIQINIKDIMKTI